MKKLALIIGVVLVAFACTNQKSTEKKSESAEPAAVVLSVDELYENATDLTDKEIVVKGTVFHVCQHGGQRCFLMGSNEDISIRIEAGEKIGAFEQELMGSDLEVVGVLREVKTEADAHNPGKEHGTEVEGDHEHNKDADEAHNIIAENQEAAEVVYFIEGLKSKEVKTEDL